tara:strand:+ start:50901 stop:51287 length:387 start_codon:yes stop_codon:yes gene_type:complete
MAKKRRKKVSGSKEIHQIAHFTFFVGLVLAVLSGLFMNIFDTTEVFKVSVFVTLVILGTIVGLFNLTVQEEIPFLVATIGLLLAGIVNLAIIPRIGVILQGMLTNIVIFVVAPTIIVALKAVWKLAQD